jgi:phosphatidylserine/phosphatidylglycerophosphate/cardiolipin synthase-like enzyme
MPRRPVPRVADLELHTLAPGGQTVDQMAARVAAFLSEAQRSLDLALYDVRLPGPAGDLVAGALRDAAARGVAVRIAYNADHDERMFPPPPSTAPELIEALPFPTAGIPGIPDLMHHKYVVRDGESVWTGSTNWTTDSWTLQENLVTVARSAELAAAFTANFEELWKTRDVSATGRAEPARAQLDGHAARAWFTPGHGEDLSHRIAAAIGRARTRVRIASPVITAGPVIGTLAEVAAEGRVDVRGVVDRTQMTEVFRQWRENPRSAWKVPIVGSILREADFRGKPSTRYTPESPHDFMHAKVTVADDVVFAGSFNLSRSGEMNAENVLELHDPELAERLAGFIDQIRERYEPMPIPDDAPGGASPPASSAAPPQGRP